MADITKLYMDKHGCLTVCNPITVNSEQKTVEKWIRKIIARGATIPEAYWEAHSVLESVFNFIRDEQFDKDGLCETTTL